MTTTNSAWEGWLARVVLLAALCLTAVAYWQGRLFIEREVTAKLDLEAAEAESHIKLEIDRYAGILRGLRSQFMVNPELSRASFRRIAESINVTQRFPGVQAIAFTQKIEAGGARLFELRARQELGRDAMGYPPPVIHPPQEKDESYVVQYNEPIGANQAGSWYNQGSESKRRAAIEQARDTGELSCSGRVRLSVAPGEFDGIIFFLPIYRGGAVPAALNGRRKLFAGAVFIVVRVDEMLQHAFGRDRIKVLDIEIYDMQKRRSGSATHGTDNLIFDSNQAAPEAYLHSGNPAFPLHRQINLDVGGNLWHVDVTALPDFTKRSQDWLPRLVAFAGVLLSLLLYFFVRKLERSRQALGLHARHVESTLLSKESAIEACANAIVITSAQAPDYPVEYVNSAFERMTGYTAAEIVGRSLRSMHKDDREQPGVREIRAALAEQRQGHATVRNYRKDGTAYWSEVYIAPVKDDDGVVRHFVAAKYDVTETKQYEAELEFHANHDGLTGLANRNLLRDRLTQAIAFVSRDGHSVWTLFLDLDRFNVLNETLGFHASDLLLKKVAERLKAAVRATDTVARLERDEFVLVLPERTDETLTTGLVQRIMEAVAQPFTLADQEFFPSCSIGIAVCPIDGDNADTLLKHARIAMYRAKETGYGNFQFYASAMNERALERLRMESDLHSAIERDEFFVCYQPQVDMRTGCVTGMEALVRWQHPQLGVISPGRFIGLAEDTGLIVQIGASVMRTACRQNMEWQRAGFGPLRVSVNLSARQFDQPDLLKSIAGILAETGLGPEYLDIELTESLVMEDVEHTTDVLCRLKGLGVHLSIDDFGTGYSSLSYLKRFPIDVLKIDQSFVCDLVTDPDDAAIVRSIISLAHSLHMRVIAEGVETESQLSYLRRHACDQIQGYYFSEPLTADAFEQLLRQGKSLPVEHESVANEQTLLLIDDEPSVTSALCRLLRKENYRILTAHSPSEAFELLALHRVQVILCDQRMPQMNGTEFLGKVKDLYPDTLRIVLSGYVEVQSILDAINRGSVYRFFTKPWESEVLLDNLREAFREYWLLHGTSMEEPEARRA
jgi:diguanylate cyclase (GGDEF)-like protein/PAS domain S-box-containing protein